MVGMKKNKRKLWIVTELFYPDQTSTAFILKEISESLTDLFEIEIICGPTNYQQISDQDEVLKIKDIKISRIKSLNFNKNILLLRTLRLIIISFQLSLKYLKKSKKNEKVIIVTNPAPLLLLFSLISKFFKRKINIIVHDVFPENTIPAKIFKNHNSFIYRMLKYLFDRAYSQFSTLIVLGRDMKIVIEKKIRLKNIGNLKIEIIENWADIDEVYPLSQDNLIFEKWNVSNKFVFLFAGNLGRTQALEEFFSIIRKVSNSLLHFVFLGEGALKEKLLKYKEKYNLHNVTIGDSFPRYMQCENLNACHVGIVTLANGMEGLGVPSKSYNIMASGKPILFFGDRNTEISLLVKEHKIGWNFDTSESLLSFFNQVDESFFNISKNIGQRSRALAENKFAKSVILKKFKEQL